LRVLALGCTPGCNYFPPESGHRNSSTKDTGAELFYEVARADKKEIGFGIHRPYDAPFAGEGGGGK